MKKFNVKSEMIIGVGIGALTIAQLVLGNKKDSIANEKMKEDVVKEVMDKLTSDNQ